MKNNELNISYQSHFEEVLSFVKSKKQEVYKKVNTSLIELYWSVGKYISQKVKDEIWGKGVVVELAQYIKKSEPNIKGFSSQNLWRMKQFYETYQSNQKLSTLSRVLPQNINNIFKDTYVLEMLQLLAKQIVITRKMAGDFGRTK